MDLDQLRQFDAIARQGTMSAAARALHLSQPALSRSLARLEAELGQPLVDRPGRRLVLNDAGRVALEHARQILRDERAMRAALDDVARRTRAALLAREAERGTLVMPMHFGAPHCGSIRRQGEGYAFEPATW